MNDEEMSFNQVRVSMKGVAMHIKVKAVKQYGCWVYYPACGKAGLFCQIAGTKTLTPYVLSLIREMGVEVEVQHEKPAIPAALEQ